MKQTLRLGRIAGIPVGVHWSVLVIMAILVQGLAVNVLPATAPGLSWASYLILAVAGAVLFLASLLAHELAHALVARHYGMPVERVTLWLLGGVAELGGEAPNPRADLLVAVAGPATSLGAAGVFGVGALGASWVGGSSAIVGTFSWLALINVVLAVFNMLPGSPLDGGRVLRAVLWRWHGNRERADRAAANVGQAIGLLLVFGGIAEVMYLGSLGGLWLVLVGWFLISAASTERAGRRLHALLGDLPVRAVMNPNPVSGYPHQSVAAFVDTVVGPTRHRLYPLRDWSGHPAGLVSLQQLAQVPPQKRADTQLSQVATPVERVSVVEASQPLAEVAGALRRGGLLLVVDGGLLVGVVSASDLARAAEWAALSSPRESPQAKT
jgi:Zn-dependent protease/CBS domain-containing protein